MFGIVLKVLYFRHLYSLRTRWVLCLLSVVYPVAIIGLSLYGRIQATRYQGGREAFDVNQFAEKPNRLKVIVIPDGLAERELMSKAQEILKLDGNMSSEVTYSKTVENVTNCISDPWTVGVQFQRTGGKILEYTLLCSSATSGSDDGRKMVGDYPSQLLQLQIAIDAAFLRTNSSDFPLTFRRFSNSNARRLHEFDIVEVAMVHTLIALGIMFVMDIMASYVVREKKSGVRELLGINGVPRWMVSLSWLVAFSPLVLVIVAFEVVLILNRSTPLLKHISPSFLAVLLIVYSLSAIVATNFIAELISHPLIANIAILIYWPFSTFLPWLIEKKYFVYQGLASILPNVGLNIIFRALLEFYEQGTELSFDNMFSTNPNIISAGVTLVIMLGSTVLFMALALYLCFVKPGPYGRARPWYWFTREDKATIRPADSPGSVNPAPDNPLVQNITEEPVALECVDLVKVFGTNKAVNHLNLKIIKNKVTVLLGHNGAGKTTLFSIMCGMFSPTSGNFYTEEYNVFKGNNISRFRRKLGYCPQENLLLNELTVQQHLVLFGMLKGRSKSEALELSETWTKQFGIYQMRHRPTKNLSGGTKRKVNLAIALTGNPSYVLLDEPSAGLDTESTVKMWDVLRAQNGNFTVIITTHNMDEADILGDYIAIMASGQLKCYGTSDFLKKKLDTGYRLNCALTDKNIMRDVVKAVHKTITGSTILYKTSRSVTFGLPLKRINSIPNLLKDMETQFGNTVATTLSYSTLDDVFVKVQREEGVQIEINELPTIPDDQIKRSSCNFGQIRELFKRRMTYTLSKRLVPLLLLLILLPGLATYGGVKSMNLLEFDSQKVSNAQNFRSDAFALVSTQKDNLTEHVRTALNQSGIPYEETPHFQSALADMTTNDSFESRLLFAIDTLTNKPTAYYTTRALQAYSPFLNALLGGNVTIITHSSSNDRQPPTDKNICNNYSEFLSEVVFKLFLVLMGPMLLLATAHFIVFPLEERITLFKHLQFMTGLHPVTYWIVNILFDLVLFTGTVAIVAIVIAIADFGILATPAFILPFVLVLLLFGVSSIMYAYVWSLFFQSATTAVLLYWLLSVMTFMVMSYIPKMYIRKEINFILPWGTWWYGTNELLLWSNQKWRCDRCQDRNACDLLRKAPLFGSRIKSEMFGFFGASLVYFLVLMFFDYGVWRKIKPLVMRVLCGRIKNHNQDVDPEVGLEKRRVSELKDGNAVQPLIVCDGLGKKYCTKTVVHDVTFTVERGECFGLVGVNGAGKTTTFGMLAALIPPSKGNVTIDGRWKLKGCEYKYIKNLAYCPQYEGLLKELSARSIIRLFGRLRGVPSHMISSLVDRWVEALDMASIANRPCGKYSGGNKRKLSLAITMIGNPAIVLLDEPTAGVDPIVRRKIYQILTISLEDNRQTIILTSHAMSECEAICDRLTIMVDGVMKCIGPVGKLKKTFGNSCIVQIRFLPDASDTQKNLVQSKIESRYPGEVTVQDKQLNHLKLIVRTENIKTYDVFAFLLKLQTEFPEIDHFNMSDTPLEQVFITFAKNK